MSSEDSPSLERTKRALAAHFQRHNQRAFLFAAITFFAAIVSWLLLYGLACWLVILFLAAIDFPQAHVPRAFTLGFIALAMLGIFYAWLDRRLTPNERARDDKTFAEYTADFLLAIPRMTLAVPATLSARQCLDDHDLTAAATLLHRLAAAQRLPLQSVPLEIRDDATREKVLFALQLTRVVDLRRLEHEWWITFNSQRVRGLEDLARLSG